MEPHTDSRQLFATTVADYQQSTQQVQEDAATFLTFMLGEEEYAVEIERVLEIVSDLPITFVPGSPPAILGVVNMRGRVVPVLSLRRRFRMADHAEHILILIDGRHGTMALA
ncbi:MAG: chemotaxis protein CheW, partial [Planctomycetota bacterium]